MGRRFPSRAKAHPLNISLLRSPCNACLPTIAATLGFATIAATLGVAGSVVGRLETRDRRHARIRGRRGRATRNSRPPALRPLAHPPCDVGRRRAINERLRDFLACRPVGVPHGHRPCMNVHSEQRAVIAVDSALHYEKAPFVSAARPPTCICKCKSGEAVRRLSSSPNAGSS